jgi:hypothetical protein
MALYIRDFEKRPPGVGTVVSCDLSKYARNVLRL